MVRVACAFRGTLRTLIALIAIPAIGLAITINGKVLDENGAPVQGARISILLSGSVREPGAVKEPGVQKAAEGATSDAAGLFRLDVSAEGTYEVHAEHEGFFVFANIAVDLDAVSPLEIHMNHLKELAESVDVRYSPAGHRSRADIGHEATSRPGNSERPVSGVAGLSQRPAADVGGRSGQQRPAPLQRRRH